MGAPSGTVTFLFTDIEGSTRLWEAAPDAMRSAQELHDSILHDAIAAHGGHIFSTAGDGLGASFARVGDGLGAALAAQAALAAADWPEGAALHVRMGLHTGEAHERGGDYFGPAVNRAARLMAIGHGGQVLCSAGTAGLISGEVALVDLGEHRLRDLSSPQRVLQVGAGAFPPLRSLNAFASNLPAQATAFVGRGEQLAEVAAALATSRVVTLTGVGGVGKTRLALQAAAEVLPGYRDGAWLVDLGPLVDGARLVELVAATFGVLERQGQPLAMSVIDFLRAKRLLVVLDNCEHVLAAAADFVKGVVAACPDVVVLATSREGLGLVGERMLAVGSLTVPPEGSPFGVTSEAEAVRLFVDRAADAKAGFVLAEGNAAAVAQLCRRLDGIPLAIELAAARVRSLTPAELAERIDERFRLLGGGRLTSVERHQTLRRAVDWSYALLTGAEQAALGRAAVFAGDFSIASAEAVISGEGIDMLDVLDLLGRLVDKSLLIAEDRNGATRFRLLETIRQYAQERLEAAGEAEGLRRRHAEHFAAFTAAAGDGMRGREEAAWTQRTLGELDNLRAAVIWAVAVGDADLALRVLAPLQVHGSRTDYICGVLAQLVVSTPGAPDHQLFPAMLAWAAWVQSSHGDTDGAMATFEQALDAASRLGSGGVVLCRLLSAGSNIMIYRGELERAHAFQARREEVAREMGDDFELARTLMVDAGVCFNLGGDEAECRARADEALSLARRLGNPTSLGYAAMAAGLARANSDEDSALVLFGEGVACAESMGNDLALGLLLTYEAWIFVRRGDWRSAVPLVARSLAAQHQNGDRVAFSNQACLAVVILAANGDGEVAAIIHGFEGRSTLRGFAGMAADMLDEAVTSVRRRLGESRFLELAAVGAAMGFDEMATYIDARLAISA
jgi:predicted ATPase/class 3 adenylate cyclase